MIPGRAHNAPMTGTQDSLHRFVFESTAVRGELVFLDASWRAVLTGRNYPPAAQAVLGDALAASVMLTGTLKSHNVLTLQIQGPGPVRLLVAEARSERTLRGMVLCDSVLPQDAALPELFGHARLLVSVSSGTEGEPYRGIVELSGATLAEALQVYFTRSEQLPTRLWLAADATRVGGLMLQSRATADAEGTDWERIVAQGAQVERDELLSGRAEDLLRRLFVSEDVRLFRAEPVRFSCTCSRARIEDALKAMGREEVESLVARDSVVKADCEFCNQHYRFTAAEIAWLFDPSPGYAASTRP